MLVFIPGAFTSLFGPPPLVFIPHPFIHSQWTLVTSGGLGFVNRLLTEVYVFKILVSGCHIFGAFCNQARGGEHLASGLF